MSIKRNNTNTRMSQSVVHNNTVYLSGQVAADPAADIKAQTQSVLSKIEAVLKAAGSDKTKLLSAIIYLRDIADFAAMNEVWDAWVPDGHAPARACVEGRLARDTLLVEVSIVAAVSKQG